ncbi:hypothetical protein OTSUT76_1276 [Orientia tsutsugamushi str. UT76]|uniref:Uncharacterized protein n=1 Tax=Orientia tsutsugamushi TaxID=784 RepID=A0A2U3QW38_ORITS|nr:hypothetical protein OTSUT76_1276 [Orientia tsutsugamushi str. UT76]SPR05152.1 Uncharacterised protein [Orientia tsutsugamushi]
MRTFIKTCITYHNYKIIKVISELNPVLSNSQKLILLAAIYLLIILYSQAIIILYTFRKGYLVHSDSQTIITVL